MTDSVLGSGLIEDAAGGGNPDNTATLMVLGSFIGFVGHTIPPFTFPAGVGFKIENAYSIDWVDGHVDYPNGTVFTAGHTYGGIGPIYGFQVVITKLAGAGTVTLTYYAAETNPTVSDVIATGDATSVAL